MQIEAMVIREAGGPFLRESLTLDEPRPDELLVRIVATGMCHTDLVIANQHVPYAMPCVLGHEGAGVVERVGTDIHGIVAGDHVVLTFNSCGTCRNCQSDHEAYCKDFRSFNLAGRRADGSETLRRGEETVHGAFFSQSSFATYALATLRNVVKVPKSVALERLGPLGCGVQTGAGAILNILKPWDGSVAAVFGAGAVGLSALLAAKLRNCSRIFVVDPVPSRRELALKLGATDVIDPLAESPATRISAAGGADVSLDTSGVPASVEAAIQCLTRDGSCGLVSSGRPGATITLPIGQISMGRKIVGVLEGDSNPQTFIPELVDLHLQGRFPFDQMLRFYDFDDINQAAADSHAGVAIKPIIRMPQGRGQA